MKVGLIHFNVSCMWYRCIVDKPKWSNTMEELLPQEYSKVSAYFFCRTIFQMFHSTVFDEAAIVEGKERVEVATVGAESPLATLDSGMSQ